MRLLKGQKILIVDDEPNMRESLKEILIESGFDCDVSENGEHALKMLAQDQYQLVISDVKMPKMTGFDLMNGIKKNYPDTPLLLITAYATVKQAVDAIKFGAEDYITKPFDPDLMLKTINNILSGKSNKSGLGSNEDSLNIIGSSSKMKDVFKLINTVAPTNSNILLEGESGTGKELIANALHYKSLRKDRQIVKVNCAAIPSSLMESELFGHVKGSFTGAIKDKKGKFELADGGTIYLDEIGDMELSLQAKILRVIQERELSPVGSESVRKIDVRIIAATNKNLKEEVLKGDFREDLFYRLNVICVKLPPLRERKEDIPDLVDYFIRKFNCLLGRQIKSVSDCAMNAILGYDWPGNIRELENAIERAVILSHDSVILDKSNLPDNIINGETGILKEESGFYTAKTQFERDIVEKALNQSNGSVSRAANILGISRHALRYQIEKLGMKKVVRENNA